MIFSRSSDTGLHFAGMVVWIAGVSMGLNGCGVDAMTAAATTATLQGEQVKAAKDQEARVLGKYKAAQDAEATRVATPEEAKEP